LKTTTCRSGIEWWSTPVILALREAEAGRSQTQDYPGLQSKALSQKRIIITIKKDKDTLLYLI
jgi:hypothetical protein